jgi:hypothetical protein
VAQHLDGEAGVREPDPRHHRLRKLTLFEQLSNAAPVRQLIA